MSNSIPSNALDNAIVALQQGQNAKAAFYKGLTQGDLWFLVQYHPEVQDSVMELKNGAPLPFVRVGDGKQGEVVPLFSSEARLDEGLRNGKVPPKTFLAAAMPAKQVLEVLGKVGLNAILNKGCSTGEITVFPKLMRDLAAGKV